MPALLAPVVALLALKMPLAVLVDQAQALDMAVQQWGPVIHHQRLHLRAAMVEQVLLPLPAIVKVEVEAEPAQWAKRPQLTPQVLEVLADCLQLQAVPCITQAVVAAAIKTKPQAALVAMEAAARVATHREQQLPVLLTLAVAAVAVEVLRIATGHLVAPALSS